MPQAVLFDLDETILDRTSSLRAFLQWQVNGMLRSDIDEPQSFIDHFTAIDDHGKVWKDEVYSQLIREFSIESWSADELLQSYLQCFCAFCTPRPGALGALEHLRSREIPVGIVTNGYSPFQERNIRTLIDPSLYQVALVSGSIGLRKPDKRIFELACQKLTAPVEHSIFVGDNPVADIQGAKRTGMRTVYVPRTLSCAPCNEADATVHDLQHLPSTLDTLLGFS